MSRGTTAIINLNNLRHNFKVLKSLASTKLVLVVKADAYGHGLEQIISALEDVDCFGVATIDEALRIRKVRPNVRILLLEGYLDKDELNIAFANNFDSVIHQQQQLDMLNKINTTSKMNIWLKYDSGMNRLGFIDTEFAAALTWLQQHAKVNELILMSHLASADKKHSKFSKEQTKQLLKFRTKQQISLSNSSAVLNQNHLKDEWCRVGLALFGVSPIAGTTAAEYNLKPVMTLQTNIIAIRQVKAGQSIGYAQAYIAKTDMQIAIIGIGYGDGYPWSLAATAFVMLNNQPATILGRVSMDMLVIDISAIDNIAVGDSVLIWGNAKNSQLPIETVAAHAHTIPYVLLCQITSRVHYQYVA